MEIKGYKKEYKVRTVGQAKGSYEVTFPAEVLERKAREAGLTPEEFIDQYIAVAYYDAFDGVVYKFESRQVTMPELHDSPAPQV